MGVVIYYVVSANVLHVFCSGLDSARCCLVCSEVCDRFCRAACGAECAAAGSAQ